jgi:transposase
MGNPGQTFLQGGLTVQKKYIVRLSDEERQTLLEVVKKLKGTSQKVKRANILLKADVNGPNWHDEQIAEAFMCRRQTVETVRKRLVTEGFDIALNGKKREVFRPKLLDGEQEAQIIALRLSEPPEGRNGWTLRLLAEKAVELEIVKSISHTCVGNTLKKTPLRAVK